VKLGILSSALQGQPLAQALDTIAALGAEVVDFTTGGYGSKQHCDPEALLADPGRLGAFREAIESRGLQIGALCCYGNPLHPDRGIALAHRHDLRNTVRLAEQLGLHCVVAFSGCPGDSREGRFPHWVVYPWPPEMEELRSWQWEEHVLPYWTAEARFALEHGVTRIAIEMHAVNAVYNPQTLLELRAVVGDIIGACFNPGHLFWQGIDPLYAIRALGDALFYMHATDCRIDPINALPYGLIDGKPFYYERERAWEFRTVGYGHGEEAWRDIIVALRQVGYDDTIVLEHEDSMLLPEDGLRKGLEFLRPLILREPLAVPEPPR